MLPEQRLAIVARREKAGPEIQVTEQHCCSSGKNRNGQKQQECSDEKRPDRKGQPEHFHAGRTHVDYGGDVICGAGNRRKTVHKKADAPATLAELRSIELSMGRQRSIRSPTCGGKSGRRKKTGE